MKITLETLLQTNPFIASALQADATGGEVVFKIVTFCGEGEKVSSETSSWYTPFLSTLGGTGHSVNATFNEKLKLIKIEPAGEPSIDVTPGGATEEAIERYSSSLLFNLIFYA